MKRQRELLTAACAALLCAAAACGSSTGDAGTAVPSFNPFGTDPPTVTGSEPTGGGGVDMPPGMNGGIPQLCAFDCARLETACPGSTGSNCPASCADVAARNMSCTPQFQAYLSCVATAPLVCATGAVEVPACDSASAAISVCING
jgi:hypothetical protein